MSVLQKLQKGCCKFKLTVHLTVDFYRLELWFGLGFDYCCTLSTHFPAIFALEYSALSGSLHSSILILTSPLLRIVLRFGLKSTSLKSSLRSVSILGIV